MATSGISSWWLRPTFIGATIRCASFSTRWRSGAKRPPCASLPPVVLQYHYGTYARREVLYQVLDEQKIRIEALAADAVGRHWIDPLELHKRWKPQFLTLCEKLCQDLISQL